MLGLLRNGVRGSWHICSNQGIHINTINKSLKRMNHTSNYTATLPEVITELTNCPIFTHASYIIDRYEAALKYTLEDSWNNLRPVSFLSSYEKLLATSKLKSLTNEEFKKMYILGWCVEMYQACALAHDDIADKGLVRDGKPSWFKHCNEELMTIYDTSMLYKSAHLIMDNHFKDYKEFYEINRLFDDSIYRHTWAQILDLALPKDHIGQMTTEYTTKNRDKLGLNKSTLFISLPIKLAVLMTGQFDEDTDKRIDDISKKMGLLWTAWDDYVDCYPDQNLKEKTRNDIEEGKCSWLIVTALQNANKSQQKILTENYGINDPKKVSAIKNVYEQLDMKSKFETYKNELNRQINEDMKHLSNTTVKNIFADISEKTKKWNV